MHKKLLTAAITIGLVTAGVVAYADNTITTVIRVIDGDTLVARVSGQETTIRLLNVDTPETKDPNEPVECLGPEASRFLEDRLPPGTKIDLQYDIDRTDQYGRTLAAVYESGSLINAEIAAHGFGLAVLFEPNRRFYEEVKLAEASARTEGEGLFDPAMGCTIPAKWAAVLLLAPSVPGTSYENHADAMDAIRIASATFVRAKGVLTTLLALGEGASVEARVYRSVEPENRATYSELHESALEDYIALIEDDDRLLAAEERAADRKAKDVAMKAAAKKAAERAAARASQKRSDSGTTPKKKATKKYTGPRCYAPGGKTWRPC